LWGFFVAIYVHFKLATNIMTNMDDLKNMGDKDNPNEHIWIDIIVRSPNESVTVYLDDFILYHSDHFDIEDL
ncbi:MAG TPA: hypothetical protein PK828_04750, partial [Limnochordia bacterium]|nr:hypothetical protein [Limnochordia bacterium]